MILYSLAHLSLQRRRAGGGLCQGAGAGDCGAAGWAVVGGISGGVGDRDGACLMLDDGSPLPESHVILAYLDEKFPERPLMPARTLEGGRGGRC